MNKAKVEDLSSYGLDIENELTTILSQELSMQIDKEIINEILKMGKNWKRKESINKIFKSSE